MTGILEVSYKHIEMLNEQQLTDLLGRLLRLEASAAGIPISNVGVSLKIDVADGGEDAIIQWGDGPAQTNWIPNRLTLFQCKATYMPPASCEKEIRKKGSTELKSRVEEVLDAGGAYILFYNRNCNNKQQMRRIREFRKAIREAGKPYADTADIRIYDANKIADWVNQYIPAIYVVCEYIGRYISPGFETWSSWSKHKDHQHPFVCNETLSGYIEELRKYFSSSVRRVARIVGLSGLGKTRLALEAFRPPNDPNDISQQILSDQTIYLDLSSSSVDNLPAVLSSWRLQGLKGLVVVDNCPLELHQRLCKEVQHMDSQMNLLTLDYNPERFNANYPYIELKPAPTDTVIKPMLKNAYPVLNNGDINRIAEFAQGFPQMAVLIAEAKLNDHPDLGSIENSVILDRLLWGRNQPDEEAFRVISACSLFERVGFWEDVAEERHFVAKNICKLDPDRFYEKAVDFLDRGILKKRGRYVSVTPLPLAIRLAANWWKKCPPERRVTLITQPLPEGMAEALFDQFSKLHFLPEARKLTSQLCGDHGPFSQSEVLNSEKGSRLFCSLAEVNPQAATEAIDRAFGTWTINDLKHVGPGRRNLVRALEKLCFWKDTFPTAARILMAFAVAENEKWSNNATGQFLQLFRLLLPGTQAPPEARLMILDEALDRPDEEYKILAIKALGSALQTCWFFRFGSVETQGSRFSQEEWYPKSWSEVFTYWRNVLARLAPFVTRHDALGELARDQVAENIRGLIQYGLLDELEEIIRTVADKDILWPDALEAIRHSIRYDGMEMSAEVKQRLYGWIDLLQPEGLAERLRLTVSIPPYDYEKDEDGNYVNLAALRAKQLAEELAGRDATWMDYLPVVLQGEQRQGLVFGERLGEILAESDLFIDKVLDAMRKMEGNGNVDVLGGFLRGLRSRNPDLVSKTLQTIADDLVLSGYLVDVTRLSRPEPPDLERVLGLLKSGRISVYAMRKFAYHSVLDHLDAPVVTEFCEVLRNHSPEGAWIALEVLNLYTLHDPEKQKACKNTLMNILLTPGLLARNTGILHKDFWLWKEAVITILKADEGRKLAEHLVHEILELLIEDSNLEFDLHDQLVPIFKKLIMRYQSIIWPKLADLLLSDDWRVQRWLQTLLGSEQRSGNENKPGVLFCMPHDVLKEWCRNNPEKAPQVLARIVPIYEKVDEKWTWHPLARWLIDHFGNRDEVLSAIAFNMSNFRIIIGSLVPFLQKQIELLKQLRDHRLPEVRAWVTRRVSKLQQALEREQVFDEEEDI